MTLDQINCTLFVTAIILILIALAILLTQESAPEPTTSDAARALARRGAAKRSTKERARQAVTTEQLKREVGR